VVAAGGAAVCAGWAALALGAGHPVLLLGLVFAQGALSFGVGSTLIAQALYAAPGAPTLAGGFATAAFNVGAALGPWAGGAAIGAGFGYRSPVWVSASLAACAVALTLAAPVMGTTRSWRARRA
jgi:DHA1 family chloramphenicol resistance protein-like MFS transporter